MIKFLLMSIILLSNLSFANDKKLKVIVSPSEPMVINDGNKLTGFEVELWEKVASKLNIKYEYKKVYFDEIFKNLESGKADIALGGTNITSNREKIVDFSYPYLNSGRSILVKSKDDLSFTTVLKAVFGNKEVIKTTLYLVLFVVVAGFGFWITEKGKDAISDDFYPGILEGIWLTFTTMTTVGYGDLAPVKWTGRVFAVILMFTGISYFGYVAAVFMNINFEEAGKIKTIKELRGKNVGVVRGTESARFLKQQKGILVEEYQTPEEANLKLAIGHIDAVVADHVTNLYFLKQDKYKEFGVYSEQFNVQGYGIALKQGSKLKEKIDHVILELKENGEYDKLYKRWF